MMPAQIINKADDNEGEIEYLDFGNMVVNGDIRIGLLNITTPEYELKLTGYPPLRIFRKRITRFTNLFNEVYSQWGRVIYNIKSDEYKQLLQFISDNAIPEDTPEIITRAGDIWETILDFFKMAIEAKSSSDLQIGYLIRGQYIAVKPEHFIKIIIRRLSPILGKSKEFSRDEVYNVLRDKKVIMGRKTKTIRLGDHVFRPWLFPAELLVNVIPDIQSDMSWLEESEDKCDANSNTGM